MSHYSKFKTTITSKKHLLNALKDMGFTSDQIRVSENPMQVEGYEGRLRDERAEIIIPRRFVGGASNDIGFKQNEDGTWGAIISDYDKTSNGACRKNDRTQGIKAYNNDWLNMLTQRYNYHHVKEQIAENNYYIESETEVNGEVQMTVKTTY